MKILTIHPINEDLRFLKKFVKKLKQKRPDLITAKSLSNNNFSHEVALREIKNLLENDMICFLSHGATRAIHGCQYRAKFATHDRQFIYLNDHGYFIDKDNIGDLKGKKIFCLSCNSDTLGKIAIEAGAKVFIGFSTIDFDDRNELLPNQQPRHYVVAKTKYALRESVFKTITISLEKNLNFHQFVHLLKITLNKEMDNLILLNKGKKGFNYYKTAANCLLTIKEGITIFGDGNIKILE